MKDKNLEKSYETKNKAFKSFYDLAHSDSDEESFFRHQSEQQRYEYVEQLNRGGAKTVNIVNDHMTARRLAMAQLIHSESEQAVGRFIREAVITAGLTHPNIMPVYDIGFTDNGHPFFTMKLIEGENLKELIEKLSKKDSEYAKEHSLTERLEIFLKICDAIAYAHSRGVIHLDLKPANIQVSGFGEVLVSDWGLARYLNEENLHERMTESMAPYTENVTYTRHDGTVKGTPGYMSPEQAEGNININSTTSDIYALGAILYAILCLEIPACGDTVDEVIENTKAGRIVSPRERKPQLNIPAGLEAVCMKAMAVNKENRYESVEQIREEIHAYMSGFATEAENAGFGTLVLLLIKRHKKISSLIAVALIFIVTITAAFTFQLKGKERIARKHAEQYRSERDLRVEISKDAAPTFMGKANRNISAYNYDEALNDLDVALQLDPGNAYVLSKKTELLLGLQQFREARDILEKRNDARYKPLIDATHKYEKLTNNGSTPLDIDNLTDLMKILYKQNQIIAIDVLLLNESSRLESFEDKMSLARKVLEIQNPDQKRFRFRIQHSENGITLDLSGNRQLTNLAGLHALPIRFLNLSDCPVRNIAVLRTINLEELNLKNTRVTSVGSIKDSGIRKLNISGTVIYDSHFLLRVSSLDELVAGKNTLESQTLKALKKKIKVIIN
ncbi:protein kinase [Verrucomicrobiota bacterium]